MARSCGSGSKLFDLPYFIEYNANFLHVKSSADIGCKLNTEGLSIHGKIRVFPILAMQTILDNIRYTAIEVVNHALMSRQ